MIAPTQFSLGFLKPCQNVRNLDPTKVQFNTVLSKIRVIVERALGVLKGRWRCLRKELEILTENVPGMIAACCILHNICIENGSQISTLMTATTPMIAMMILLMGERVLMQTQSGMFCEEIF